MEKESRWAFGYNECHEKDLLENETKWRDDVQLKIQTGSSPKVYWKFKKQCKNVYTGLILQHIFLNCEFIF